MKYYKEPSYYDKKAWMRRHLSYMSKKLISRNATYDATLHTCQRSENKEMPRTTPSSIRVKEAKIKKCHVRRHSPYVSKKLISRNATYDAILRTWQRSENKEMPRMTPSSIRVKEAKIKKCHVRRHSPYVSKKLISRNATYDAILRTCQRS